MLVFVHSAIIRLSIVALVLSFGALGACGDSDGDDVGQTHADAGSEAEVGTDAAVDVPVDQSEASMTDGADVQSEPDVEIEASDAAEEASDASDAASDAPALDPCTVCHGSSANPAPPKDTKGASSPALASVGAHQSHLVGSGLYRTVQCGDCHAVPSGADTSHADGLPVELDWGAVAKADQVQPQYANGKCSVYCHGTSLSGGSLTQPIWTSTDGTQAGCGSCHGVPPPAPHPKLSKMSCSPCHTGFTGMLPSNPSLHADGKLDVLGCGKCHAVPPATGSHVIHYGDSSSPPLADYADTRTVAEYYPNGAAYYMYGCGNCHPLDDTKHANGAVEVELFDAKAPAGSLKARSKSTASFAGGKCSDVYCHSSGQAAPAFVQSPAWVGGKFAEPRCAACHANPPKYPSGGAGSATANTHVVMADDGWELGHFGGLPGPWHTSYHGGTTEGSAPMTCQTCHYDTVAAANAGPGGFYYLDTTGNYDLGGQLKYSCTLCHTGQTGAPAQKGGAVASKRHVNGQRDVVFDPRTTLPANVPGVPAAPNRPSKPYWVTAVPSYLPAGSAVDGTTWSFALEGASYDPTTKTCSKVPCHLKQSSGAGQAQYEPLRWGLTPVGYATCGGCHQFN